MQISELKERYPKVTPDIYKPFIRTNKPYLGFNPAFLSTKLFEGDERRSFANISGSYTLALLYDQQLAARASFDLEPDTLKVTQLQREHSRIGAKIGLCFRWIELLASGVEFTAQHTQGVNRICLPYGYELTPSDYASFQKIKQDQRTFAKLLGLVISPIDQMYIRYL